MSIASLTHSESVTIKTVTESLDTFGAPRRVFASAATSVPMRIEELSAAERLQYSQDNELVTSRAFYAGDLSSVSGVSDAAIPRAAIVTTTRSYRVSGHTYHRHPSGVVKYTELFLRRIEGESL